MHLSDVHCGECKRSYALKKGCKVCAPARDSMVRPDLTEFEKSGVGSLLTQNLRLLSTLTSRLEHEMYDGIHYKDRSKNPEKHRYYRDQGRDAMALAKSVASLCDAARKYEMHEAGVVEKMSLEQKLELVLNMLRDFPQDLIKQASLRVQNLLEAPAEAELE